MSVVMPVYNGERFLAEAIESILKQTLNNLEFVIVDDCSTDGSAAIIRDYAKRDERIRLIQHERKQYTASARNSGIAASSGQFIAAMDCDDISFPQRLDKQVDFLQSHPDIGVVGSFRQTASEDLTGLQFHAYPQHHADIVMHWVLGRTTVAGASIMARRNVLISVGGYEDSRRTSADKELFSRLYGKTRFANIADALYLYRQHDTQTSVKLHAEQQMEAYETRRRWLSCLWGAEARASVCRLDRLYPVVMKFSWWDWWLLRRDVKRLINGMVAAKVLVASDMPWVEAEMNGRLESAMPRRWQMFLHWKRHHFGR